MLTEAVEGGGQLRDVSGQCLGLVSPVVPVRLRSVHPVAHSDMSVSVSRSVLSRVSAVGVSIQVNVGTSARTTYWTPSRCVSVSVPARIRLLIVRVDTRVCADAPRMVGCPVSMSGIVPATWDGCKRGEWYVL